MGCLMLNVVRRRFISPKTNGLAVLVTGFLLALTGCGGGSGGGGSASGSGAGSGATNSSGSVSSNRSPVAVLGDDFAFSTLDSHLVDSRQRLLGSMLLVVMTLMAKLKNIAG